MIQNTIKISLLLIAGILSSFQNCYSQKTTRSQKDTNSWETEYFFAEGEKYFILEDYAKAVVSFQKALDIDPDNAAIYYKLAQIYSGSDDNNKALIYINKAIELDPTNKFYYLLAAELNTKNGDFELAEKNYLQMMDKVTGTDKYLFDLAAVYLYDNKLDLAIKTYDQIEVKFGISEESSFQKQKIYLQENKLDLALGEIRKLISAYPDEPSYKLHLAEIYMNNNMLEEAINEMEELLADNASYSRARLMLSDAYDRDGQIEKAEDNLLLAFQDPSLDPGLKIQVLNSYRTNKKVKNEDFVLRLAEVIEKAHPSYSTIQTILGDISLEKGDSETALYHYKRSAKLDPSVFNVWQNILSLEYELNQIDSILVDSEEAIELFPNQSMPYYMAGIAYIGVKKYQEAIQSLQECKKRTKDATLLKQCNSLLGDAYFEVKDYQKSDQAFESVLSQDPTNDYVANNYSYYLSLRKDKLDRAFELSSKLVDRNPDDPAYLDTYAWVLYQQKKYEAARKVMEKVIANPEANAVHFEHYGDILYRLGLIEEAVTQWKKAKALHSNSELIDKKIADKKIYE